MNFFLRAKHWQLFLLMFVPIAIGMANYFINIFEFVIQTSSLEHEPEPEEFLNLISRSLSVLIPLSLVSMTVFILYQWAIGVTFIEKNKGDLPLKTSFNKVVIMAEVVFAFLAMILLSVVMNTMFESIVTNNVVPQNLLIFGVIYFLGFVIFILRIFNYLIIAKNLESVFTNQVKSMGAGLNFFLMILFYPFGIWFLQPKINKFERSEVENDTINHLN